ncbi:MAG: DoxX family protein [Micromonosporaceae bacterium]
MNATLWIVQILLAGLFLLSGAVKSLWPKERLVASGQTGVAPFPVPVIRFTAAAELLAAVGLVVPWLTGIAPALTPAAAGGLMIVMAGAAISHTTLWRADQAAGRGHREALNVAANVLLLVLCGFVLIGRL